MDMGKNSVTLTALTVTCDRLKKCLRYAIFKPEWLVKWPLVDHLVKRRQYFRVFTQNKDNTI